MTTPATEIRVESISDTRIYVTDEGVIDPGDAMTVEPSEMVDELIEAKALRKVQSRTKPTKPASETAATTTQED